MRVTVDRSLCESNALCMGAAPEVFELDDDDVLVILTDEPPADQHAAVLEAVAMCPKQALAVSE